MITVYQISAAASAPRLELQLPSLEQLGPFDGSEKAGIFTNSCQGRVEATPVYSRQFYILAPGALLIPEMAFGDCEDMYYTCSMGSEILSIKTSLGNFRAINPTDTLPRPLSGDAPCVVDKFYCPLFRIEGESKEKIFCIKGLGVPGDEFKYNYDLHEFQGLEFSELWTGDSME